MNTWKTANAVVRRLEGDVVIAPGVRDDVDGWVAVAAGILAGWGWA